MADFTREAELTIVIPDRELRDARDELEDALADVPVGVSASGGGGGGAAGTNSAREQRRRRREFRWARQRTDDAERQVELLENIEGELTEGGLGGGGGLFGDLLGLGGEGAGIATDLGTSVVDAVAPALGSLVGTALGQQVGGGGGGGSGGGSTRLSIEEPLGVTVENTPLAVEDDGQNVSVEVEAPDVNPTFEPVFQPTFRPDFSTDFELPDVNINGGRGGSGLSEPVDVIVQNTPLPVSGRGSGQPPTPRTRRRPTPTPGPSRREPDFGEKFRRGLRDVPIVGDPLANFSETQTRRIERFTPGVSPDEPDGSSGGGGGGASTGAINVTVNADVQSAVQQAVEQVRREQERQRQELRRDLESQISDLRREVSSGGRSGLGGSVR